jgi:hypothetical protein
MTLLTCAAVRRRLPAFYDRELAVRDLIAIEAHLKDCPPCARELRGLESVGDALRSAAAPGPADDWTGLQPGVISRMRAEAHESWAARVGRMFDDMHLVWIGLASTVATLLCGAVALSALHFAAPERDDSLAAVITVMSAPAGPSLEHYIAVRNGGQDTLLTAATEFARPISEEELVLALSAVVTQEGRVGGLAVLKSAEDRREMTKILKAISRVKVEPAYLRDSPEPVNLGWLLPRAKTQTTVRAKAPRTI